MSIFKKILSVVAPTLAAALPGPLGSIAKKAITDVLGLDPDTPDEKIDQALATASPEILQKMREAEQQFKIEMKKLDIDIERIIAEDRAGARQMYIQVRDATTPILAWAIIASWIGVTILLFFYKPPLENEKLLTVVFGILTATVTQITGFYYGSSTSSRAKDETIANLGGKE